ncbi:hypothetical protein CSAL01_05907 [Colletotrichum salicis]|uniref:Uncharacterized protein n=1 Tax=Colletotrichum salicis TaxID=1209931 RepID=A0A135UBI6_9PEZI|nr:hypothetical protein CSAL01_05907 [Colletotrichum salicis]
MAPFLKAVQEEDDDADFNHQSVRKSSLISQASIHFLNLSAKVEAKLKLIGIPGKGVVPGPGDERVGDRDSIAQHASCHDAGSVFHALRPMDNDNTVRDQECDDRGDAVGNKELIRLKSAVFASEGRQDDPAREAENERK